MAWNGGDAMMPVYLFVASLANGYFVYQSIGDVSSAERRNAFRVALLGLSLSEFAWVVPCWIQCFLVFADVTPREDWQPTREGGVGCDVQGFYSVFASVSSQILAVQIAYLTYKLATKQRDGVSTKTSFITITIALLGSLVFSLLPFMGLGEYAYSGEGFCYFDWTDAAHVVLLETVSVLTMCATLALFIMAYVSVDDDSGATTPLKNAKIWIAVMILNHLAAWILWIPAGIMGAGYDDVDEFPKGYMITGAILGHMQALVAPLLYGWLWRSWTVEDAVVSKMDMSIMP